VPAPTTPYKAPVPFPWFGINQQFGSCFLNIEKVARTYAFAEALVGVEGISDRGGGLTDS